MWCIEGASKGAQPVVEDRRDVGRVVGERIIFVIFTVAKE